MIWKEMEVQFSINRKRYSLFIVKRLLKKDMIRVYERIGDGKHISGRIIPVKISTSTFWEIVEYWLDELKRYLVKKRGQKRSQTRSGKS